MTRHPILTFIAALSLGACQPAQEAEDGREPVDTILHNGKIATIDAGLSIASAVAIEGDRIVAVGGEELFDRYVAGQTVDLGGRFAMPGFIDSHTHLRGQPQRYIDLTKTTSIEEIKGLVRDKVAELGVGEWITGYGWSEDFMAEQRRPLRDDLDEAAPDNPVILTRAGGHSAVSNSMALRLAEVDASTPQPDGGVIEIGEDGRLNGVIRERQDLVSRLVPRATPEDVREDFIRVLKEQFTFGITSFTSANGGETTLSFPEWETIYGEHRGELPRAYVQMRWDSPDEMAAFGRKTGDGDEHLRIGPIKMLVDGGFTGPAAYTKEPYKGEAEYRGKLSLEPAEINRVISQAHAAGWQLGIHAIGDAAIELTIDEIAEALDTDPRVEHRHYLNHFTVMPSSESMATMAEYGMAISQQPNFTYTLEGRYVDYLDGDRVEHNNPLRTPMNHGIHVAISSDILPIGPMVGLYAAVTRKGLSGRVFAEEEALTMMEALQGYTLNAAYLSFEEDLKGSIEPGKLADIIVLDQDLLTVEPDHIMETRVLQTWLGGKLVYEHPDDGGV
jgi:predicted amidohydrolase YtcJ